MDTCEDIGGSRTDIREPALWGKSRCDGGARKNVRASREVSILNSTKRRRSGDQPTKLVLHSGTIFHQTILVNDLL